MITKAKAKIKAKHYHKEQQGIVSSLQTQLTSLEK